MQVLASHVSSVTCLGFSADGGTLLRLVKVGFIVLDKVLMALELTVMPGCV